MPEFADTILRGRDYACGLRKTWEPYWEDLADYFNPALSGFTSKRYPGERRGEKIVDTVGWEVAGELARHLDGFLTPDGFRWLYLRVPDKRINENPAVRAWLDIATDVLMYAFNSPQTGFGVAKAQMYDQVVTCGTSPLYIGEGEQGLPVYKTVYLGQISLTFDGMGNPVEWYRTYDDTALELVNKFGASRLPQEVIKAYENEPGKTFVCIHGIRQRREDDPMLWNESHRYIEGYVLQDKKTLLADPRGYEEFPAIASRWEVYPDENYGRSPAMRALPDVKGLQQVEVDTMKLIHKHVDPNYLYAEGDGTTQPRVDQRPGQPWFAQMNAAGHFNIQPVLNPARADEAFEYSNRKYARVERLFFLHAFRMPDKISKDGSVVHMSATEWAGRQAEAMKTAGPLVARQRHEFLSRMVNRSLRILARNGWIGPPPMQLRGSPVMAEYVSPLAVAQRSQEANSMLQWMGALSTIAAQTGDARALDIANFERFGRGLGMYWQVPMFAFNTPEEYSAIQKSKAEQANLQAQAEQAALLASASKDSSQALATQRGV